jgi:hypothetical protein
MFLFSCRNHTTQSDWLMAATADFWKKPHSANRSVACISGLEAQWRRSGNAGKVATFISINFEHRAFTAQVGSMNQTAERN